MSLNAAAIAILVDHGMSGAEILAVAEALEIRRDPTAAARQAKYRSKKAERNGVTRDVTRDVGSHEEDILPSREEIPQEAKASLPHSSKKRGERLPDDWEPKPLAGKAAAMVACWQAGELERELAKFKNYWFAKSGAGAVSTNWQRNWVNWLINADERKPRHGRTNGLGRHQPNDGLSPTTRAAMSVFGPSEASHERSIPQ